MFRDEGMEGRATVMRYVTPPPVPTISPWALALLLGILSLAVRRVSRK